MQVSTALPPASTQMATDTSGAIDATADGETPDAPLATASPAESGKFASKIEAFANFAKGSARAQEVHAKLATVFELKQSFDKSSGASLGEAVSASVRGGDGDGDADDVTEVSDGTDETGAAPIGDTTTEAPTASVEDSSLALMSAIVASLDDPSAA